MANIKSAKKRVLVTRAKTLRNQIFKTQMRTLIKKYNAAVESGDKEAAQAAFYRDITAPVYTENQPTF